LNIYHQNILRNLVIRNLKLKYKNSFLGYLWSLITPLVYLVIFNFVFGMAFDFIENYSLYVLTGLVFWIFFANSSNEIIASLLRNSSIIKAIHIPLEIYPLSSLITEFINLLLTFVAFIVLMLFFGFQFSWETILILPVIVIFSLFILGFSTMLSVLNIYFRDVSILWNTINPALFYMTPIAFTLDIIPVQYHWILKMNPLYFFFKAGRDILYNNSVPGLNTWLYMLILTSTSLFLGYITLKKLQKGLISNM